MTIISTPAELTPTVLNKAVGRYYKDLQNYATQADHELALRPAFQNMLAEMAQRVHLTLVHEMTIRGRIRPDGVLCDAFHIQRGYWEAKGPRGNLEDEIRQKIKDGYPLENALFENTRQAVLYQAGQRFDFDLHIQADVIALLKRFLTYQKPDIANFEQAVVEFQGQIPNIAKRLLELINEEQQRNARFVAAFTAFTDLCRTTLNPKISADEIREMLVQHLLTERLFRTVFDNPDFVSKNAIAAEIEKVIQALTSRTFNRNEFMRSLDPFYGAIEAAARGIETWSERQHFLNMVYERFFQGFAVQKADTLGIVYTPQEIVEFMVASIDEVLKREFGKSQGLATPGVTILDPCVGTGNFIVNIIKHIASSSRSALREKYVHDIFCNEITLLPYYIASMNIEHEYHTTMSEYVPFEGICFVDTLELAESQQRSLFVEKNTERIEREKEADIMVVVGNPPYNVGQRNENDNNKNRKYKIVDERISDTYVKHSSASLKSQLYDAYVRFFRWATDRLGDKDGVVCFVSNNNFIDGITFDGFRKHMAEEFTHIYHLNLGGNARKGGGGNIFGIKVGVGITILVRKRDQAETLQKAATIFYHQADELQKSDEKLAFLKKMGNVTRVQWQILQPDEKSYWITEGMHKEFGSFYPLGTKDAKASHLSELPVIFKTYSGGIKTNRDSWAYDFSPEALEKKIREFSNVYNGDVDRWKRRGNNLAAVDEFVTYDDTKIKWSEHLKLLLMSGTYLSYSQEHIRLSLYRPFTKSFLYFDSMVNDRQLLQHLFFPTRGVEEENIVICVPGPGDRKGFGCFATNLIASFDLAFEKAQCFPYYTYATDGSNRRENITDWVLAQFQTQYGEGVSKWDIFHYVYAMLHHPQYCDRYAENLKRDLPHIPLLLRTEVYQVAVRIGQALMDQHVHYEQQAAYPLTPQEDSLVPFGQLYIVEKMKLAPDHSAIIVNKGLTLAGIPETCFRYRLGNRSALEWVIDQYQVRKDARSGMTSDPNRLDDPEYIVRLVKQVITVSVKTVELVDQLAQLVRQKDWMGEMVASEQ
jgi:predicted helicase